MQQRNSFKYFNTGTNSIVGILFVVLFFVAMFYIAKGVFTILVWAAPVFLLITLFINYKVVLGYIQWIWNTLKTDTLRGIIFVLLTVFGFPLVAVYLFLKALGLRSLARMQNQMKDQMGQQQFNQQNKTTGDDGFEDYELLEELNKPRNTKTKEQPKENPYDSQFE